MDKVHHNATLTAEQVRQIREALKTKPVSAVMKQFGITRTKVMNILLGITYRNVK